jgi:UDP-N-acetylglucosamine 1-carboxyvinyltransferase
LSEDGSNMVLRINGGRAVSGRVPVRGAKNLVPKAMVASLLTEEDCSLSNTPNIADTEIVGNLLSAHGAKVTFDEFGEWTSGSADLCPAAPSDVARWAGTSRIPILLAGPLLHRLGEAFIPALGGCSIGTRPVDFHLALLSEFGATVEERPEGTYLRAGRLHGIRHRLPFPSVGATEQAILTGVLAEGRTEISNAAIEPEIMELLSILQRMGAVIHVKADRVIEVIGVERLTGFRHFASPDRLEIASWAVAAMMTNGDVTVPALHQPDMFAFLDVFRRMGGGYDLLPNGDMHFYRGLDDLLPAVIETDVHPGLMTDWQSPLSIAATQAQGSSVVHETVYEDRLGHLTAIAEAGGSVQLLTSCLGTRSCRFTQRNFHHSAIITGPSPLLGRRYNIPNLRAGFSYVLYALIASGTTTLTNSRLIYRGYEDFPEKLATLGVDFDMSH